MTHASRIHGRPLQLMTGRSDRFLLAGEHGAVYGEVFEGLMQVLYHDSVDILSEEGILKWAEEKEHADTAER